MRRYKIGIIFCGGCNCYFDREALYKEILETFSDRCLLSVYSKDSEEDNDLVVLINGCQSECLLDVSGEKKLLLINNKNYMNAVELISKEMGMGLI